MFDLQPEDGHLDAIPDALQERSQAGASVILGDVVGNDDRHQRHDVPVQDTVGSTMLAAIRWACMWRSLQSDPVTLGSAPLVMVTIRVS